MRGRPMSQMGPTTAVISAHWVCFTSVSRRWQRALALRVRANSGREQVQQDAPWEAQSTYTMTSSSKTRIPALALSAFAFPSEGSYHSLAGINGAGLFSRSNGQLVALQLEESHLVRAREKFTPRYVDLGRKLVSLDREFTGVSNECLQECCRVIIVCCRLAICRCDDERHVPVRREDQPCLSDWDRMVL